MAVVLAVGVPGWPFCHSRPGRSDARVAQAAGEQAAVGEVALAVHVAHRLRLAGNIKPSVAGNCMR